MCSNTSGSCAHLCATTFPTPPAPMIRTLGMTPRPFSLALFALAPSTLGRPH
jgi:hypothetical protein